MKFWDTSAIVPLVLEEPTSEAIRSLFDQDRDMVVTVFTIVEATSAIWRRWREDERSFDLDLALRTLADFREAFLEITDVIEVTKQACAVFRSHAMKAADAMQLANVLVLTAGSDPGFLPFVTLDRNLARAARAEGLTVINVNEDPAS